MLTLFFTLLVFVNRCFGVSQIALFSDANCKDSLRGLEGPNGYPNGTCTDLRRSGPYGSFQVVGLDPGCTVTIYVEDTTTTICGGYQEEIRLAGCHNSTFVYYSIDFCDANGQRSSESTPKNSSSQVPLGAIVGGVVGGVLVLGIIIGFVFWMLRRQRRQPKPSMVHEIDTELRPPKGVYRHHELSSNVEVYKSMPVEVEQPPVELAGHDVQYKPSVSVSALR